MSPNEYVWMHGIHSRFVPSSYCYKACACANFGWNWWNGKHLQSVGWFQITSKGRLRKVFSCIAGDATIVRGVRTCVFVTAVYPLRVVRMIVAYTWIQGMSNEKFAHDLRMLRKHKTFQSKTFHFHEQKWQPLIDEVSTFLAADVCLPIPRSPGLEIPFKPNLRLVCPCLKQILCDAIKALASRSFSG